MKRWLCFAAIFCVLVILFCIGLELFLAPNVIASAGCPFLTETALSQALSTDPNEGCPDDPSQDTVTPSLKQPAPKSERYFFTEMGYQLDQYLFRNDVITTSGRLTFAIDIDRYYSPLITTTTLITNGLVDPNVITNLINNHLLPPTATLTLEVYDIDDSATGCAEVDHVYLNNQLLFDPTTGITATLSGTDQDWHTWSIDVPIQSLRLPIDPGVGGGRPSALNEVAIEINTQCSTVDWAVKVDWGALAIQSPLHRPILFVHGWRGDDTDFELFEGYARGEGIPTLRQGVRLSRGLQPISDTVELLKPHLNDALQKFGVDKVNLFAHSKGGLVSRYLLRSPTENVKVENLFTFGTPHHGHDLVTFEANRGCPTFPTPAEEADCFASAAELRRDPIRTDFNYNPLCQPNGTNCGAHNYYKAPDVAYYTIVGASLLIDFNNWSVQVGDVGAQTATFPWNNTSPPFPTKDTMIVDVELPLDHLGIKDDRDSFDAAIDLLINNPPPRGPLPAATSLMAAELASSATVVTATIESTTVEQTMISLAAGEMTTMTVPISGDSAFFYAISNESLTFELVDPTGSVINPAVAATDPNVFYGSTQGTAMASDGWSTLYRILNPIAGNWQASITVTNADNVGLYVAVDSTKQLQAMPDKVSYLPSELVTLQASLQENLTPITGTIITGTVAMSDGSTVQLTFHDDGTNGDTTPNDGLYSAQFNAPNVNSRPWITLRATNGIIARLKEFSIDVVGPTATLQQVTGEQAVDTNGNGLYDVLDIGLLLNVQTAGSYSIQAVLAGSNGDMLTMDVQDTGALAVGSQSVNMHFSGKDLRNASVNGPYTLTNLFINYNDPTVFSPFTVAIHENLYTTAAYNHRQFEGYLLKLLNSSEQVVDLDSDGLYDELVFDVQLDVLAPGMYEWGGQLVAANGTNLGWAGGSGNLDSQTPLVFTFAGTTINKKGADGPYRLQNVSVARTSGALLSMSWYKVHTTAPYTAAQFEPPLACGGPVPPAIDADAEQRLIELVNIERANHGLPPMKRTEGLMDAARYHAADMSQDNYFDHPTYDRINGSLVYVCSAGERIRNYYTDAMGFGENIASSSSPGGAMSLWMGSPGHRANILSNHQRIGVGYYAQRWVQVFSSDYSFPLIINGEAAATSSTNVNLYIYGNWSEIRLRNNGGAWSAWQPFANTLSWTLDAAFGVQIVEAEMRYSNTTVTSSDTIEYAVATPTVTPTSTPTSTPLPPPTLNQPDNPDNDGNYTLTWSTVADATSYELQEKSGVVGNYTTIYSGVDTAFAVTNRSATTHCYHARTIRAAQIGVWSNQVCVTVAQPTPTPTFTPLPTATPLPLAGVTLYVGSDSGGTVGGVSFADEDLLAFDAATSSWSLYFDGSDVGITGDIDGFYLESDGTLLLTLEGSATLADVGAVTANDIVRFTPTTLGETTAGVFSWVLDGSDVELEAAGENIDGIARTPDGRLLLSTSGGFNVTDLTGDDKDLLAFNATSLGESSAGSWEFYFDGSDVGLTVNGEDIWDLWVDSATGYLYLTTYVNYSIPGPNGTTINGDGDDIFVCVPGTLGENTTCTYSLYWDGDLYGFDEYMDSMSIVLGGAQPTPTPTPSGATATPTATPFPTATPTLLPTATPVTTPTDTPVATPTATPGGSSTTIYAGSDGGGTVGGITFADEDILAFDLATSSWSLFFDGSDVGLPGDIDAFYLESDGTLLLSIDAPATLANVGSVDRSDIIRFTPTTLGETTAGTFSWVLDGSDVELADVAENIDALSRAPDGRLVISTFGGYAVTGASGSDADLLIFNATSLGESSAGTWELYFDGSDVALTTGTEDLWSVWINPTTGSLYLNTYLNFSASSTNSLSGDGDDIFICVPSSLGQTTTCTFSLFWNGDDHGFNFYLDSMSISGLVNGASVKEQSSGEAVTSRLYLPLITR